jgi:hypothetical protein
MTSLESALYTVLAASIDAAEEDAPLFEVELLATVYEPVTQARAIRIGDSNSDFAPASGGAVEEWDVLSRIEILSRPEGETPEAYIAARENVRAMTIAVAQALFDNPTLSGGVGDSRILGGLRGWGSLNTQRTAVANLHVIGNETGAALG